MPQYTREYTESQVQREIIVKYSVLITYKFTSKFINNVISLLVTCCTEYEGKRQQWNNTCIQNVVAMCNICVRNMLFLRTWHYENHPLTCHAERSEASVVTSQASWPTPDAERQRSMTGSGRFPRGADRPRRRARRVFRARRCVYPSGVSPTARC